jgi:glucose-1-phosphate thymidylyltransferase
MRAAEITKAYIVIREGKWDIPAYLCDGRMLNMDLAYLMVTVPFGPPYTLDQAYPFVRDAVVAFGFPDILFEGDQAFEQLLSSDVNSAEIILGLFGADRPELIDMVDIEESGHVREIVIQPPTTHLTRSWAIAVWTPVFTEFMHGYLASLMSSGAPQRELSVGRVIQAAIRSGLRVRGIPVSDEPYFDIGTPEGLARALERFGSDTRPESGE